MTVRFHNIVIQRQSYTASWASNNGDGGQKSNALDVSTLWYSKSEYAQFKASLRNDTKQVIEQSRKTKLARVSGIISDVFRTIASSSVFGLPKKTLDTKASFTSSYLPLSLDGPDVETLPFHDCPDVVGLERVMDVDIYRNRRRRRSTLMKAIEDVQSPVFLQQQCRNDRNLRAVILGQACETISSPSVLFAQYLGRASAAAAFCSSSVDVVEAHS